MAFNSYSNNREESNADRPQVDWEALNKYVVETAGLQEETTLVGTISSLIDLGIQPQEDAKLEWTGTPEEEAAEIEKNSNTYFEDLYDYQDKKTKRYKRFPVKPAQSVALTIDFGDILLDKSQYFGQEAGTFLPLRLVLGGEFTPSGGQKIVAKPLSLVVRKNDKTNNQWSIPFNNTLYKMAIAGKVIEKGQPFLPENLDKLVGLNLQFKAHVYFKDDKYYTEKCAFVGALARGQVATPIDKSLLSVIQFTETNDEQSIKNLRASIKNTIRKASNFEGSKIAEQIGEGFKKDDSKQATTNNNSLNDDQDDDSSSDFDFPTDDDFNSDIPF